MMEEQRDEFYYVTLTNENYAQPSMPEGVEDDILRGLYRVSGNGPVRLLGAGAILPQVMEAARRLEADWGVSAEVWSATSFSLLAREAAEVERWSRLHPLEAPRISHVARCLPGQAPIVAATDYVRAVPQMIAGYLTAPFTALGTDGFGRSDTRAALRRFFEVDAAHVVVAALGALGMKEKAAAAVAAYGIDAEAGASWTR
jgi:pyruvate dehydrogenase E1 component